MRNMKCLLALLVALVALLCPVITYAAPTTLSVDAGSTSSNLIVITNPPSFSSTSQGGVVFCGYGSKDTKVTLYLFNSTIQCYEKMNVTSSTINDSGVFWKKVNLSNGLNKILIYAEKGNSHQVVRREVTVTSSSFSQRIKDYTVNISTALQMGR